MKMYFYPATFTSLFSNLGWLNVDKIRAERKTAVIFFHTDVTFFKMIMVGNTLQVTFCTDVQLSS